MQSNTQGYIRWQLLIRKAKKALRRAKDQDALAARWMFGLNRLIHDGWIDGPAKEAVYELKKHIVQYFYQSGYCRSVSVQVQTMHCWHTESFLLGDIDYCCKCDNTGIYRQHRLYLFTFEIDGITYHWHQPAHQVRLPVIEQSEAEGEYQDRDTEADPGIDRNDANLGILLLHLYLSARGFEPQTRYTSYPSLAKSIWYDIKNARWSAAAALLRIRYRLGRKLSRLLKADEISFYDIEDEIPF